MKPTILLALRRGGDRLAEALLDRADLDLVLFDDAAGPSLDGRGVPYRRFFELLTETGRAHAEAETLRRAQAIAAALASAEMRGSWPEYDDITWAELAEAVRGTVRRDFGQQIAIIDTLRRWNAETNLRLIIVQQDASRDARTLVTVGRGLGIPSLNVSHGVEYGTTNACDESHTDMVAVYGPWSKAVYESYGVAPERIVMTGNFEWDIHARPPLPGYRETACEAIGVAPARPVIVYAMTFPGNMSRQALDHRDFVQRTTEAVLRAFAELAARHAGWQFVVRPHPNDLRGETNIEALAEAAGLYSFVVDKTSAVCCLGAADALVCSQSNLAIEAVIAGIPVVNCALDEFASLFGEGVGRLFAEDDAVLTVRRPEELASTIKAALTDAPTRQGLEARHRRTLGRFLAFNDGKSVERVCALALKGVKVRRCESVKEEE